MVWPLPAWIRFSCPGAPMVRADRQTLRCLPVFWRTTISVAFRIPTVLGRDVTMAVGTHEICARHLGSEALPTPGVCAANRESLFCRTSVMEFERFHTQLVDPYTTALAGSPTGLDHPEFEGSTPGAFYAQQFVAAQRAHLS